MGFKHHILLLKQINLSLQFYFLEGLILEIGVFDYFITEMRESIVSLNPKLNRADSTLPKGEIKQKKEGKKQKKAPLAKKEEYNISWIFKSPYNLLLHSFPLSI